jgi:hypothetical protein
MKKASAPAKVPAPAPVAKKVVAPAAAKKAVPSVTPTAALNRSNAASLAKQAPAAPPPTKSVAKKPASKPASAAAGVAPAKDYDFIFFDFKQLVWAIDDHWKIRTRGGGDDEGPSRKRDFRWPVIFDETGRVATFARHRAVCLLDDPLALRRADSGLMLARAILGSLKFEGNTIAFDMSSCRPLMTLETIKMPFENLNSALRLPPGTLSFESVLLCGGAGPFVVQNERVIKAIIELLGDEIKSEEDRQPRLYLGNRPNFKFLVIADEPEKIESVFVTRPDSFLLMLTHPNENPARARRKAWEKKMGIAAPVEEMKQAEEDDDDQ